MHALYKLVQVLLYPEVWVMACLAASWWFAYSAHSAKLGRIFLLAAGVLFFGMSTRPITELLVAPLESHYAPPVLAGAPTFDAIVVLGGGYKFLPTTGHPTLLQTRGLDRLTCGLIAWKRNSSPTLLLSGGPGGLDGQERYSDAEAMQDLALQLGIPASAIRTESRSLTTKDEAIEIKRMLPQGARILLVTSALHIPRSVALFRRQGLDVTPLPCDYITEQGGWGVEDFIPSAARLAAARAAVHEYVGLAMLWLSGRPN